MATLTICMTIGLASAEALLAGFSNTGVLTVAALFPVAAGMYATGAITLLSNRVIGLPKGLREAQLKILPPVAIGSAFLNNTPLVAMMIPVVRDITQATGLAGTKLYMPLSFVSLLGGATTLIGTSVNLIIAGLAFNQYGESLNVFFPFLAGAPAAVVGLLFILYVGNRLLPGPKQETGSIAPKRSYRTEFVVQNGSPLDGKAMAESGLAQSTGYAAIAVRKADGSEPSIGNDLVVEGGDLVAFAADAEAVPRLWTMIGLLPPHRTTGMEQDRYTHQLVEVVVSNRARAVGRTVSELPLPDSPYEVSLVGIAKNGAAPATELRNLEVEAGDAAILEVAESFFYENRREEDFTLTKRLPGYQVQRTERAVAAVVITVAMVVLAAFGVMSMLNAALLAGLAMLLTGCLSPDRMFRSIEWDTLVVLGAAVGLEAAVTDSGLSAAVADLLGRIGGGSAFAALAAVFIGCVIMTNVITNAAAAAFMFPISASLASSLGVSPEPFLVILMLGCSYAFINPAGYQTNLMVQKPGGYTFMDFVKVGLPLTLVAGIVALLIAPLVYGF
jgi:di/tricarboxylate transporter/Trk K+ transport system NAD-binding subunit